VIPKREIKNHVKSTAAAVANLYIVIPYQNQYHFFALIRNIARTITGRNKTYWFEEISSE